MRLTILFGILLLLFGFTPSSVFASKHSGAGDQVLNTIKTNPCGNFHYYLGGIHSAPVASCGGYKGVGASINVLVRSWDTNPAFPIVGVPFYIGVGVDHSSAGTLIQTGTITWANKIKFNNFKIEMRLSPAIITTEHNFNGEISGDSSMQFDEDLINDVDVNDPLYVSLSHSSSSSLNSPYYVSGSVEDTTELILTGYKSSYNSSNSSSYQGEPAYAMYVSSYYLVEARATWDFYQEWETKIVGYKKVCSPGRNNDGFYECFLNPGDWYWQGHYTTRPIYVSGWSAPKYGGQGGWVNISVVYTDKVRWPSGTIHNHIPILVYQSQPLLQKP